MLVITLQEARFHRGGVDLPKVVHALHCRSTNVVQPQLNTASVCRPASSTDQVSMTTQAMDPSALACRAMSSSTTASPHSSKWPPWVG